MGRRKVETTPFYRVSLTAFQKKRQLRNLNIKYVVSPLLLERWTHLAGGLRRTFTGISFTQKSSNYKEIKQLANKSSLRSLTHTYTELKDSNNRLRVRRADHLNMFQRSSYQKKQ